MEQFRNSDGTYNGVKVLAAISGMSEAEIQQTWEDLKSGKLTQCSTCRGVSTHRPWCSKGNKG